MKFAKKIDAAKAMTDSNLKLSKLQTLALQAVPHSSTQRDLQAEINRLYKNGYKISIPEKYQPKSSAGNEKFAVKIVGSKSDPVIYEDKAQAEKSKRNAELLGFEMTIKKTKTKKTKRMKKTAHSPTTSKKLRPNPFAGADDVYVTKYKIAVTRTRNRRTKRGFSQTKQTKYYEQNSDNLKLLKAAKGNTVRVGRKGINYRTV